MEARKKGGGAAKVEKTSWRTLPIQERLTHSLVNGISEFVDQDTEEARKALPAPLDVSQSPRVLPSPSPPGSS